MKNPPSQQQSLGMGFPSLLTKTKTKTPTPTPCCSKVGLKRGPWTAEEDEVLASFVRREGEGRWRTLPKRAGLLRCGKSCRLRWMNYLRPSIKRGPIAPDEEDLILRLHRLLGNRWSLIAGRIPGRTDNEIKNYWNTHLRKKLVKQGIDPRTHKPFTSSSPDHHPSAPPCHPATTPNSTPKEEGAGSETAVALPNHRCIYLDDLSLHRADVGWQHGGVVFPRDSGEEDRGKGLTGGCSTDDVFSALFDSFINEDIFAHQQINNNCIQDGDNNSKNRQVEMIDPMGMGASFGLEVLWKDHAFTSPVNLEEGFPDLQYVDDADK